MHAIFAVLQLAMRFNKLLKMGKSLHAITAGFCIASNVYTLILKLLNLLVKRNAKVSCGIEIAKRANTLYNTVCTFNTYV